MILPMKYGKRPWEPEEDNQLREMVEAGKTITMISLRLKRTVTAVRGRLARIDPVLPVFLRCDQLRHVVHLHRAISDQRDHRAGGMGKFGADRVRLPRPSMLALQTTTPIVPASLDSCA